MHCAVAKHSSTMEAVSEPPAMHAWVFHQGMYATSRTGLLVLALVYATFKVSNKVDALLRVRYTVYRMLTMSDASCRIV